MKLTFKDNTQSFIVTRVNRNYDYRDEESVSQNRLDITFPASYSLEDIKSAVTEDSVSVITLAKSDNTTVTFEGYSVDNLSQYITDEQDQISLSLTK